MVDNLEIPNIDVIMDELQSGELSAVLAEFKLTLNNYLKELTSSPVRSLSDVISFNRDNPDLVSHSLHRHNVVSFQQLLRNSVTIWSRKKLRNSGRTF